MKTIEYHSFSEDVVESKNQNCKVPESYQWVRQERWFRLCSAVLYQIFRFAGILYCKCFLHTRIKNRKLLEQYKQTGFFLFANHTQPIGDVFLPAWVSPRRIYTVASPANLGVPVIGKLLPYLGILPVPENLPQMRQFREALDRRLEEKSCIVLYPEAHVWPYYTKIRPFSDTSFRFPAEADVPAFCMTATYQRRRFGKKPRMTVYLDGPFWAEKDVHRKVSQAHLKESIFACMQERSRQSDYEYIHYTRRSD
ncbi:MAG: 1-acyl-sn-glycerol-3-phosphate acyltransferase [Eubacteriales bacterium]|nr:1-acyl-sn-glycerol-3-phosphate acyltransferase [Eubacteriales bacterium]